MKWFLALMLISVCTMAQAEVFVGSGFSTVTQGRTVPVLYAGLDNPNSAWIISSVGVKNDVYYHSAYQLSYFKQTDLEPFWWGKIRAGLGGGIHYAQRGYQDGQENLKSSDASIGPAIRVTWAMTQNVILGLESFAGIGGSQIIILSTQQISTLFLGVRF
jgi:hypothetical protein